MKKIIFTFAITSFSTLLLAQQAFDGFNFQLGIGGTQNQINASNTNDTTLIPNPNINNTTTGTSFNGMVIPPYLTEPRSRIH